MRRIAPLALLAIAGCQSVGGPGSATRVDDAQPAVTAPVVRGRALCLERIAAPAGATIDVQLIDDIAADSADVAARATIARMRWTGLPGPPFEFALPYDPTRVQADRRYSLRATLRDANGHLLSATSARVEVVPGAREAVEFLFARIAN